MPRLAPGSLAVEIDISNEQSVESALAKVLKQFGRLDILVNNAGVNTAKHRVNIDQFPLEEWERIVKIDLTGTFLVSRSAARIMLKQKDGRIINISSVLGVIPARLQCAFTAAKAGVVHLTRTMAIELGEHGILVNCVAPGSTSDRRHKAAFLQRKRGGKRPRQESAQPYSAGAGGHGRRNGPRCAVFCRAREWIHHGADFVRRWWLERGGILPRFLGGYIL